MRPPAPPAEAPPRRRSPFLLLFAPLPGIGHWAVGRGGRGLLAFAVFTLGLNLLLMAGVMAPVARLSPVWGWSLAGAAVAFSLVDVSRIVLRG